jgi:hypothetical protein
MDTCSSSITSIPSLYYVTLGSSLAWKGTLMWVLWHMYMVTGCTTSFSRIAGSVVGGSAGEGIREGWLTRDGEGVGGKGGGAMSTWAGQEWLIFVYLEWTVPAMNTEALLPVLLAGNVCLPSCFAPILGKMSLHTAPCFTICTPGKSVIWRQMSRCECKCGPG